MVFNHLNKCINFVNLQKTQIIIIAIISLPFCVSFINKNIFFLSILCLWRNKNLMKLDNMRKLMHTFSNGPTQISYSETKRVICWKNLLILTKISFNYLLFKCFSLRHLKIFWFLKYKSCLNFLFQVRTDSVFHYVELYKGMILGFFFTELQFRDRL